MPKKTQKTAKETAAEVVPHSGKARVGAASARGTAFTPTEIPATALAVAAAVSTLTRPRPATSRYPISLADFNELKVKAERAKGKLKFAATLVDDKTKKKNSRAALLPAAATPESAAPAQLGNFAGLNATTFVPPDCTLAAGPAHLMVAVNARLGIFPKTGGPALFQQDLTAWFANKITNAKIFDPKLMYDQHAGRWVLLAVALPFDTTLNQSWFLISVSQGSDPMGAWWNYLYDATRDGNTVTNNWADYPCLGLDNQALYITANMFRFGGSYQYAKLRILPKAPLYAGSATPYTDFVNLKDANGASSFTIQPCHTYGAPQVAYFVNSLYPSTVNATQNTLTVWTLTNPLTAPALTKRVVTTDPYGFSPNAAQRGGGTPIHTGDVRILNAVFRGGSVWTALTSRYNWGDGVNVATAHWFQINPATGALVQQGILGAQGRSYFFPVVMPDGNGNMTLLFSRVSAAEFASIGYTGRLSSEQLGRLQPSAILKAGLGNYARLDGQGQNRWGDYNGIACDPTDNRTVWLHSEYANVGNTWGTWIGSTKY